MVFIVRFKLVYIEVYMNPHANCSILHTPFWLGENRMETYIPGKLNMYKESGTINEESSNDLTMEI